MEFKDMTIEELEARKAAIASEIDAPKADLNALDEEVRGINAELETRKAAEAKKAELRAAVAAGAGEVKKSFEKKEEKKVKTLEEIRASKEYMDAYRDYIIKEDDRECRSLLTELADTVSGVPVPSIVDGIVRTAWEKDEIMNRVRKTYIRGVLRVPFEYSATEATVHGEGDNAPDEEQLIISVVEMVPGNIKKWITISDETIALGLGDSEAFLRYVYDELTYQIVRYLAKSCVGIIADMPYRDGSIPPMITAPYIAAATPGLTTVPTAYAYLSDEATNPVVIMNKLTYAKFVEAQAAANFSYDPFMGLPVLFSSELASFDEATSYTPYAIVGDLSGLQVNFPEGDDVIIKYDDLSLSEKDLVKVVGRLYAAVAVTAPGRFVRIAKEVPSDS